MSKIKKRKRPAPCKDCTERTDYGLCHMTCERYLEWEKETREIDAQIREERRNVDNARGFIYRRIKYER